MYLKFRLNTFVKAQLKGERILYAHPGVPEFTLIFSEVCVAQSVVFWVVSCGLEEFKNTKG